MIYIWRKFSFVSAVQPNCNVHPPNHWVMLACPFNPTDSVYPGHMFEKKVILSAQIHPSYANWKNSATAIRKQQQSETMKHLWKLFNTSRTLWLEDAGCLKNGRLLLWQWANEVFLPLHVIRHVYLQQQTNKKGKKIAQKQQVAKKEK